jgi:hypothetical protein
MVKFNAARLARVRGILMPEHNIGHNAFVVTAMDSMVLILMDALINVRVIQGKCVEPLDAILSIRLELF